ncbi:hypothetical protein DQ384_01310 [Sphaerisporangium album]|uniref:Metalloprotease-like protein n=1 Tax=Sphaerisporangium album TaxID=509200 RepID=A0A367FS40_9ACTN|nr:neutral zinc metallopeptidase [Sphaerisporangium album]RCG33111.1 hypothetical protein DQ384_01310 [Sphaerisporangium album]
MRRILSLLSAYILLTACATEPPPEVPMGVGGWTTPPALSPSPSPPPPSPTPAPRVVLPDRVIPPRGRDAAVKSPLYTAPRLAKAKCPLPAIRAGSLASGKRYGAAVSACLDGIWARGFEKSGLYFKPPLRRFVPHRVKDPECGKMPRKGAAGTYCGGALTYYVLLKPSDLSPSEAAWVAEVTAHEYAHHIQEMLNILDYDGQAEYDARTTEAKNALSRRLELQAECLAGVALKAMGRAVPPLWEFRTLYQGTLDAQWVRDHGTLSTQLRWFERGYRAGGPKACDTWKAPARDVT